MTDIKEATEELRAQLRPVMAAATGCQEYAASPGVFRHVGHDAGQCPAVESAAMLIVAQARAREHWYHCTGSCERAEMLKRLVAALDPRPSIVSDAAAETRLALRQVKEHIIEARSFVKVGFGANVEYELAQAAAAIDALSATPGEV